MEKVIKILIAEDHEFIAESYAKMLRDSSSFKVIGIVGTAQEVYYQLKFQEIDILLLDLILPNQHKNEKSIFLGNDILDYIRENNLKVKTIILSTNEDASYIKEARKRGAMGYLCKKVSEIELREAIRTVANDGLVYIDKNLMDNVKKIIPNVGIKLTEKELNILKFIAEGLTSKEIAEELHLAHNTIKDYRDSLIAKFNAINSANLVKIALEKGYF